MIVPFSIDTKNTGHEVYISYPVQQSLIYSRLGEVKLLMSTSERRSSLELHGCIMHMWSKSSIYILLREVWRDLTLSTAQQLDAGGRATAPSVLIKPTNNNKLVHTNSAAISNKNTLCRTTQHVAHHGQKLPCKTRHYRNTTMHKWSPQWLHSHAKDIYIHNNYHSLAFSGVDITIMYQRDIILL